MSTGYLPAWNPPCWWDEVSRDDFIAMITRLYFEELGCANQDSINFELIPPTENE